MNAKQFQLFIIIISLSFQVFSNAIPSISASLPNLPNKQALAKKFTSLHANFSGLPASLRGGVTNNNNHTSTGSGTGSKMDPGAAGRLVGRLGWCGGCMKDDEPPEITYCVVDDTGNLNLQAVTPAVPMPDEEELNLKFSELVVSVLVISEKWNRFSSVSR